MFDRSSKILKYTHLLGKIAYFQAALKQVFYLCHLVMKLRVNEINLRKFTLNLNEKLYLPMFEKRIHPKYLQNFKYSPQR